MNAKHLLLIALMSIVSGCRTKNKLITNYEEKKQESELVKNDLIYLFSYGEYQPGRYMLFLEDIRIWNF
ncbi:hypothetical protein [Candidatus Chryseobacterium massiliense]|uniref:Lipoprotein n=1 Tax=Candidatus Chryseobacterium massiliense TaxID=204089 RepID=A0A3D9AFP0_9FLAO|nr:hypothetical protein [Candidatus Chryseobacterium massiliae]REC40218.1 hypothetical protein DRF68_20415 [Candidatus Chryseobacterium massiliae]